MQALGQSGASGSAIAGATGGSTSGSGGAGRSASVSAGASAAGMAGGTAGSGAPQSAGMGGATAGSAAPTAGIGGSGGSAGAKPGGNFIRGSEPTEQSASTMGPYMVDSYTDGFKAPVSYGGGTIYYPKDADPPFAIVVACPGFTAYQTDIAGWGPYFASHGIVTMTIDTATTLDSVTQRADEIWEALDGLKAENDRSGGPLQGKLDTMRAGVMGWSMGGGGSWINASRHPELKSAFTLAGHNSTAGGTLASPDIMVPTLLCAGSADTGVLGGGMSQPVYESISESTPKMLYEIAGGDHWVCNDPSAASFALGRYGLSWQKVFLEGDERYRKFLLQEAPGASDFRTNVK